MGVGHHTTIVFFTHLPSRIVTCPWPTPLLMFHTFLRRTVVLPWYATTKPRYIRQLASECSQIMAGVGYVVTMATQGFSPPFWCKWKLFTLKNPGFHAPLVLKPLLHSKKLPKLASRAWARANSQVGAPSRKLARQVRTWRAPTIKLARANCQVGAPQVSSWRAPSPDLARAKFPPTDPTIDLHTIVVTGNSVPHVPLRTRCTRKVNASCRNRLGGFASRRGLPAAMKSI